MKTSSVTVACATFVVLLITVAPANSGDSAYGKVTGVKRGDVVILEYGGDQHELHLVGIDVPRDGPFAAEATEFVSELILGKNARMRFATQTEDGKMMVRLFTDDPQIGIKDVGVLLVRNGLARRQIDFDYKYGELSSAEEEARAANRGLWASVVP